MLLAPDSGAVFMLDELMSRFDTRTAIAVPAALDVGPICDSLRERLARRPSAGEP